MYRAEKNCIPCIKSLLKGGALLTIRDTSGKTAINYARGPTRKYLENVLKYIKLVKNKDKVKIPDALIRDMKKYLFD
jgi:hypothetical protein